MYVKVSVWKKKDVSSPLILDGNVLQDIITTSNQFHVVPDENFDPEIIQAMLDARTAVAEVLARYGVARRALGNGDTVWHCVGWPSVAVYNQFQAEIDASGLSSTFEAARNNFADLFNLLLYRNTMENVSSLDDLSVESMAAI